ncbi:MAG: protein-export chaperone SecB [Gammaproteobacteria bacterium]|nr:protein-export chaperone SecB [Gammaproteobacteria bacterium]
MAEEQENQAAVTDDEAAQGKFGLQKIYVKDVSFEIPDSPMVFQEEWEPSVNMDIGNTAAKIAEDIFEAVLSVTITVKSGEKTMYLIEAQQAGIFHIAGLPDESINKMLATTCPNILFPFARETISDLVTRGGFPQLLLAPVNFDALYAQKEYQAQQEKEGNSATTH